MGSPTPGHSIPDVATPVLSQDGQQLPWSGWPRSSQCRHMAILLFITTTGCCGIPRNSQPLFFQVALHPVKPEPALRRTYWLSEIASQDRCYPSDHPRNTTRGYKARQTVSDEERLTRGGLLVREGMSMIKGKNLGGAKEGKRKHKVKARI